MREFDSVSISKAFRRLLHVLARPVKVDRGRGGIVIYPYRGYGSRKEVFLIGRVFRQPGSRSSAQEGTATRDLLDLLRRFLRRGVGGAVLVARFAGTEQRVAADRDGYFRVHLEPAVPPPSEQLWHTMDLELVEPKHVKASARGELYIPPDDARYVVISDIDDTVMYTGVANKAMMMWRLFVQGADSRVAFPGVAAFYKALHRGLSGCEMNPMLYVSRGPWSIYEVLDAFFGLHTIPVGPVVFLREWGLTLQRPLPRKAKDHKIKLIRSMLALYGDLPFILIGDSGQHDPEMYSRVVRENPGRVVAIYIRNVSRKAERSEQVDGLAAEVVEQGSTLLLASDSFAMARHAYEHGLISPAGLSAVLEEREREMGQERETDRPGTEAVYGTSRRQTARVIERGDRRRVLRRETGGEPPGDIAVESDESTPAQRPDQSAPRHVRSE